MLSGANSSDQEMSKNIPQNSAELSKNSAWRVAAT